MNEETWSENRLWKYRVFVQTFVRSRSASASPLPPQPSHPSSPFLALTHLHDSKNHNCCILLSVSVWGNLSAACTRVLEPHWLCRRTISWYRCHFSFMSLLRRPFDLFIALLMAEIHDRTASWSLKKRNELMFILATICRTEVQKSLSIIARFTGGANLLLEQCECRSFHFPLHLYLWKKARRTCSWFKSTRLCHCFLSWRPSEGQQSMFLLYGRGCQRSRRSSVLTLQNFNS